MIVISETNREVIEMFPLNLKQLSNIIGGTLLRGNPSTRVLASSYGRVREMKSGIAFFMRLSQYVPQQLSAMRRQKSAVIVTTKACSVRIPRHHSVIIVPNPYHAYWRLARWQRQQSQAFFIGITGSAGKTTTKEMLAAVLMRKYKTLKSYGNLNVFSSLPLHLMRLNYQHRMAVLEMGMASFGNIRSQCQVVHPKLGIVTNVGEAHAGSLGSSLGGVVKAKQELVDGIVPGGTLVLNADDRGSRQLNIKKFRGKVIRYGIKNTADIRASHIQFHTNGMTFKVGTTPFRIPSLGRHNVYNALAVIAAARRLGVPETCIQQGLQSYKKPYRRLQPVRGVKHYLMINDTYNANPTAAVEGLRVLKRLAKKRPKVAVIGDMLALGGLSKEGHRRVGKAAAKIGIDYLVTVGLRARDVARAAQRHGIPPSRIRSFPGIQKAHSFLRHYLPAHSVLYFKASHDTGLNQLVHALKA